MSAHARATCESARLADGRSRRALRVTAAAPRPSAAVLPVRASGQGAAGATAASGSQLEAAFRFRRIMMVLDLDHDNKPAMMPTTPSHGHGLREGPEDPPAGAVGFMVAGHGARSCQWSLGP